jgi:N-Acetylglucosaminyltransferase-IV (GnT-IV) conserved region
MDSHFLSSFLCWLLWLTKAKVQIVYHDVQEPAVTDLGHREIWSQIRFSFGYSGVLIHDEDAYVFGMLHFLLYQEKPCDLLVQIANVVRNGETKNHITRWNKKNRFIKHMGKFSSLEGKTFSDKMMTNEEG